jgi:hypothetical protein
MSKKYTTNFLEDTNGSTGSANQVLISTPSGIDWVDGSGSGIIGGPYLPLSAGASYPLTGSLYLANVEGDQKIQFQRTGGNVYSIEHDSAQLYFYNRTTTESPLVIQNDGDVLMNAGNVGIGTTSPSEKLQVNNGKLYITESANASTANLIYLENSGSGGNEGVSIKFNPMFGAESMIASNREGAASDDANLTFHTALADVTTERMRITSAGDTGIGVTTPRAKLDVAGGIKVADDTDTAGANKVGTLRYRTSGNNSYVDMCMQTGASTYAWINVVQNNW